MKKFIFGAVLCFSLFGMVGNAHANFWDELGKVGEVVGSAALGLVTRGPVGALVSGIAVVCVQNPGLCDPDPTKKE